MSKFTNNLRQFRLITFDVTDTVLKFKNPPLIEYSKVIHNFGYKTVTVDYVGQAFRESFKYMTKNYPNFGKTSSIEWQDWWRMLIYRILNGTQLNITMADATSIANTLINRYSTTACWLKVPATDELIGKIKIDKKTIGIISNFDPSLKILLDNLNFPKTDFILTSYDAGFAKPDMRIFEKAQSYCTNCLPEQALHIGNTPILDYIGARNAGWKSALITNGSDEWKTYAKEINENHIFKNLHELLQRLDNDSIEWE